MERSTNSISVGLLIIALQSLVLTFDHFMDLGGFFFFLGHKSSKVRDVFLKVNLKN